MKWSYKVVTLTDTQIENAESTLNTYGSNGWQVVSIIRIATDKNVLIAKRQK